MYKHILIATDGSEQATRAVTHGVTLAKELKATVAVVTVTEMWSAFKMAERARAGSPNPLAEYEAIEAAVAKAILADAGAVAKSAGVACKLIHVPDQPPADGIVTTAKREGCDLIVMGSRGLRGINKILLGSRAQEVLTTSTVPVMIVH
jgi:nucleotide-binding universal stress UspA family protein